MHKITKIFEETQRRIIDMHKDDIAFIRGNFAVGEKVKVPKMVSNDKSMLVEAEILGKYPHVMLVSDGLYKWCVSWVDMAFI